MSINRKPAFMHIMFKRLLIIGLFIVGSLSVSYADSPLTSTEFWKIHSKNVDGKEQFSLYKTFDESGWGNKVMEILCSSKESVENRLCLVNYISWKTDGQNHYTDLVNFYCQQKGISNQKDVFKDMSGEMMIIFAYVKAMDNYSNVSEAIKIANKAVNLSPKSRAVNMIAALIKAQAAMDSDWSKVYKLCHDVEINKSLTNDFSDAAVQAIMEYINLYK